MEAWKAMARAHVLSAASKLCDGHLSCHVLSEREKEHSSSEASVDVLAFEVENLWS